MQTGIGEDACYLLKERQQHGEALDTFIILFCRNLFFFFRRRGAYQLVAGDPEVSASNQLCLITELSRETYSPVFHGCRQKILFSDMAFIPAWIW